jgi:chorismate synthase
MYMVFRPCNKRLFVYHLDAGRVAAGAIAEKYLREAFGVEIVAFVSSVGKVHLQANVASSDNADDDEVEDALTPEFRKLLATITREQVDQYPTRCPNAEVSERMTKVELTF